MAVDMRLPTVRKQISLAGSNSNADGKHLVVPGDVITSDTGFMRGHGTYMDDEKLTASVAGEVERVNKLICVRPLKTRYNGEVGDVIVGRITEVQQKRWKVETNSRLDSVLLLSSVNLPGGELLGQGVLVQVSPSLVKRQKTHFHNLPCGASIILGNNGFLWLYPTPGQQDEEEGGYYTSLELVPLSDREVISRLRNCLLALAAHKVLLYDTSVLYCYESSLLYQIKDILKPETMDEIVMVTRQRLLDQEG
ncbi:exosome complex component RRP4 isoform X3 [Electrophorus electricus]|uniref:exosome complex component RRP4 isoform X3 n=1 Tax=Electrophorus electricus TaxID=8005 RepID=UPI0015D08D2C|nr:exosome complex component RRP4 isoform X3 [Electrophorus electricus]